MSSSALSCGDVHCRCSLSPSVSQSALARTRTGRSLGLVWVTVQYCDLSEGTPEFLRLYIVRWFFFYMTEDKPIFQTKF